MIADAIERAGRANADLLTALDRLQAEERVGHMITITTAMRALRRCVEAEGLSPGARQEVKSALRMCRAALGIEES